MKNKTGHSIKVLAKLLVSILTPLLGRGWERLLLAVLLLGASSYAYAQNTADGPYLNSWHQYSVTMGSDANTPRWNIYSSSALANADAAEDGSTSFLLDDEAWINYPEPPTTGGVTYIEIYFDKNIFTNGSTWYLVFSEMNGNSCVARREFPLTVTNNQFQLTLSDLGDNCNSETGHEFDNADGTISNLTFTTTVEFTINLSKAEVNFRPSSWEFSGTLSITAGGANNSLGATLFQSTAGITQENATNNGSWNIDNISGGDFQLHVTGLNTSADYTTDAVSITVNVDGDITKDYTIELQLNSGTAYSGSGSYTIITDDNLNGTVRTVERTLYGVPDTPEINASN